MHKYIIPITPYYKDISKGKHVSITKVFTAFERHTSLIATDKVSYKITLTEFVITIITTDSYI